MSGPSPSTGIKVGLTGPNSIVSVPAYVDVAPGTTTTTFNVDASSVNKKSIATIRASMASVSKTTTLTVMPVTLTSVLVNPVAVTGGVNSTGNIILSGAVAKKTIVTLSSSSTSAVIPKSITIGPGESSVAFSISTTAVTASTPVTITATLGGQTQRASLTVDPAGTLSSIVLTSPAEVGGINNVYTTAYGVVNLATPAGNSDVTVQLASSDPSLWVQSSITIYAGQTASAQFDMQTYAVTNSTPVTITATTSSSKITIVFYVEAPFQVTTNPSTVIGGQPSAGQITIPSAAPTGGMTFALSSFGEGIGVPATATIPAGATTVTFPITTIANASQNLWGAIYATDPNGAPMEANLMVDASWTVENLWLDQQSVSGGNSTSLTVVLNGPAPANGESVVLTSYNPAVATVPATVIVPAGQTTVSVPVATSNVSVATSLTISATVSTPTSPNDWVQLEVTSALPGITYTLLNPANATNSTATGVTGIYQVGSASNQVATHAGIWQGTANSFVDLNPANWVDSVISGVSGNLQVGLVSNTLNMATTHAAVWQGTFQSFFDLNPPGVAGSTANGVSGNTIVGSVLLNSGQTYPVSHASLWSGASTYYIDLDPQGTVNSTAFAVDGQAVVGFKSNQAALWSSGSAASYVNLQPSNWNQSSAAGISGNTQVGAVWDTSNGLPLGGHAARWKGSASTFTDLQPVGAYTSEASAVKGDIVVGSVMFYPNNVNGDYPVHAAIWSGDASTFIDLQAAVGATWASSSATAVYSDSNGITIVGNCDAGAVLWHIPPGQLPHAPSHSRNANSKPK